MAAWKLLLDCVVLICSLPILILELWVEPFHRGFFAEDLSIRLPFKQQSVPEIYALVAVALVFFTILITELVRDKSRKDNNAKFILCRVVPAWAWETGAAVGVYAFGLVCEHLLITATKTAVGRLRPHFYDVCMPVYNASDPLNIGGYIQQYSCAHHHAHVKDARKSFPSGHTGFSMYSAVFFIFYVQSKGKWRGSKLLRHAFQFVSLLAAWYVGLTRIQEHYHYWSDVAVGGAIGSVFAALMVTYVLKPQVSVGSVSAAAAWDREPAPQNMLPRPAVAR